MGSILMGQPICIKYILRLRSQTQAANGKKLKNSYQYKISHLLVKNWKKLPFMEEKNVQSGIQYFYKLCLSRLASEMILRPEDKANCWQFLAL